MERKSVRCKLRIDVHKQRRHGESLAEINAILRRMDKRQEKQIVEKKMDVSYGRGCCEGRLSEVSETMAAIKKEQRNVVSELKKLESEQAKDEHFVTLITTFLLPLQIAILSFLTLFVDEEMPQWAKGCVVVGTGVLGVAFLAHEFLYWRKRVEARNTRISELTAKMEELNQTIAENTLTKVMSESANLLRGAVWKVNP